MFLRKIDQIEITKNLRTVLMPILWVDEGIELDENMVELLNSSLIRVLLYLNIIVYGLIVIGFTMFLVFIIWYYYGRRKKIDIEKKTVTPIIYFIK